MKNILKKQNGIAALAVIIIVVLSAAAGGTAFLGVRSVVTGEPFLQPFEDMGLMEIEEDDDTETDKSNNEEEKDAKNKEDDNNETEEVVSTEGEESSLLVTEINDDGVECYTIVIDLKEVADGMVPVIEEIFSMYMSAGSDMISGDTSAEDAIMENTLSSILELVADMFTDCEMIIDCYANGNDVKQLLLTVPYEQLVENVYNKLSEIEELMREIDPTAELGIEYGSYEEMLTELETAMKEELTTENLRTALSEELGTEYQEIVDSAECVIEDGKIQFSINLTSIDIDSYVEPYRADLEELGIDPDNVIETAVDVWNEYIDDIGYDGLIESAMSMVMGAYNLMSY